MKLRTYFSLAALALTAVMLAGINSCKKHDNYDIVYINQGLKDYYNWQEGSYWVYKDSLTGDIDSFVVTKYSWDPGATAKGYNVQNVGITVKEYSVGRQPADSTTLTWNLVRNDATVTYGFIPKSLTYGFGKIPFTIYDSVWYTNYTGCIDTAYGGILHFPSYTINTLQYAEVYEMYVIADPIGCNSAISRNDRFYINKDAGLIKIVLNNYVHRAWELERYHIVR